MSYRTRVFVGIRCDQPGCRKVVDLDDMEWYADTDYAQDMADEMEYQTIDLDEGDWHVRHYCPLHTHATCVQCGCQQTGKLDDIMTAGWQDPLDTDITLCPMCAKLPAIKPCECGGTPILYRGGCCEGLTLMGSHAAVVCRACGRRVSDDAPTTVEDIARQVIDSWNEPTNPGKAKTTKEER